MLDHTSVWQQMAESWLLDNKDHSVLLVRYEELQAHTKNEIVRILNFLDVPYNSEVLDEVGWTEVGKKAVPGTYDVNQVDYVNSMISKTADILTSHPQTRDVDVSSYQYRYS